MTSQVRRAALSVHLNIAEGSSRRTESDRKRFYEIARGSVIEIDTVLDLAVELEYCSVQKLTPIGDHITKTFKMLSGMISAPLKS
jgi:four helix bundle protein